MYKACIFDLDGTLIDTLVSLTYSVNSTLAELQLPMITEQQCEAFVGNGAKALMEQVLLLSGDKKLEHLEQAMVIYGRIFASNCTYQVKPYEGIKELLQELLDKKIKLAILSNKPHAQAVYAVKEIFGEDVFACVQGQCEGIPHKPDPVGLYKLAAKLGVKLEECVYVGDSEVDIKTGLNAQVETIGVTWGFRTREVLKHAGALNIVDSPQSILKIIS